VTSIYIKIYERTYKGTENQETIVNGISPTNGWTNGKDKSRNWNIPQTLCQLSTRQLDRIVGSSRIPV